MKYLAIAVGLTAGNFIWQWFTAGDYGVALERSYFQAFALLALYWAA